jgi:hypothetical protein
MNWINSTNAKEIGTLYLIFSVFAGMIGTAFSVLIRLELSSPGVQVLQGDHQLFNVIISAHAFIMIFFMVMPGMVGGFGKQKYSLFFNSPLGYNNIFIKNKIKFTLKNRLLIINNNFINNDYLTLSNKFSIASNKNKEQDTNINLLRSQIGPYLAGLIEGDGTIAIHKNGSNINKYNPKIIIVFKKADLPLANYLQNITKCGTVLIKPDRGYVLWQIQDIVSIFIIISIINGFMRTPKIEALNRAIVWLNNYININKATNISHLLLSTKGSKGSLGKRLLPSTKLILDKINILEIKPLDQSPIDSNAWLSGFTDADGNFSINIHKRKNKNTTRVQLYYRLENNQNYHKSVASSIFASPPKGSPKGRSFSLAREKGCFAGPIACACQMQGGEEFEGNKLSFFPIMSKIGLFLGVTVYSRSRIINDKIYYSFIVMSSNKSSNSIICDYFNKYPLLSSK